MILKMLIGPRPSVLFRYDSVKAGGCPVSGHCCRGKVWIDYNVCKDI